MKRISAMCKSAIDLIESPLQADSMPALADVLLERLDYQADCLRISRPINSLSRT